MANKLNFGKLRANSNAVDNSLRHAECACDEGTPCQDTITVATGDKAKDMIAITFEGISYDIAEALQVPFTDHQGIRDAILSVLEQFEIDPYVDVADGAAGAVVITHIGHGSLSVVTFSDGTDTATRVCDYSQMCTYTTTIDAAVDEGLETTLSINGTETAINSADAANADTDITAAITAAGVNLTGGGVTVTANTEGEGEAEVTVSYTITIVSDVAVYLFDGDYVPGTSCDQVFHA